MTRLFNVLSALTLVVGLAGCIAAPIEMTPQTQQRLQAQPPIRFLLTFDDGPSASSFWNPTDTVLDSLAQNPVQPNIKAVFFVQTGAPRAGDSDIGRRVMHREHAEGQILGFHTATHFHTNHRSLSPEDLEKSLTQGSADIAAITGAPPTLVRPPFWNYDKRTFAAYQQHGMHVFHRYREQAHSHNRGRCLQALCEHLREHVDKEIHALARGHHRWFDLQDVQIIARRLHENPQLTQPVTQRRGFFSRRLQGFTVTDQLHTQVEARPMYRTHP